MPRRTSQPRPICKNGIMDLCLNGHCYSISSSYLRCGVFQGDPEWGDVSSLPSSRKAPRLGDTFCSYFLPFFQLRNFMTDPPFQSTASGGQSVNRLFRVSRWHNSWLVISTVIACQGNEVGFPRQRRLLSERRGGRGRSTAHKTMSMVIQLHVLQRGVGF